MMQLDATYGLPDMRVPKQRSTRIRKGFSCGGVHLQVKSQVALKITIAILVPTDHEEAFTAFCDRVW